MTTNKINLRDKFGQMFILGLDTYEINEEIESLIKDYKIGGVVLYKKNYTSIDTMVAFVNRLKEINRGNELPLFIAIDQENGRVNRFPKDIEGLYSALSQAECNDDKSYIACNKMTTFLLKSVGVNMNFAPVLDILHFEKNKAIGNRSYGNNKEVVLKYALPFMKEMQKNNIVSVVKHFPNHGLTPKDSHVFLPKINDVKLLNDELTVYEEAIKNGADAIMLGHLKIKGYGASPASINRKIINELLVNKFDYKGLIVTDDLRMKSLSFFGNIRKKVIKSMNAGANLIMIKYKKGDSKRVYEKLYKKLDNFEIKSELVENSYKKIKKVKKDYYINDNEFECNLNIDLINEKIKKINNAIKSDII